MRLWTITSRDGVRLSVQEWSDSGPPIVLLHGLAQSHGVWHHQTRSALVRTFRIVTIDLRGHGASDAPAHVDAYRQSEPWAGDLEALIRQLRLERPVLVGWSYAGRVINDYLRHHGDHELAAIQYVAATTTNKPGVFGPAMAHVAEMVTSDAARRLQGARQFAEGCFARRPPESDRDSMVESALRVPAQVLDHLSGRSADYDAVLASIRVPVRLVHGTRDQVVLPAMSEHTRSRVSQAALTLHDGVGHAPFLEDAARFSEDLAQFARCAQR